MWSRWSRSRVNAYGQPDRKISAFFLTTPHRITVLTVMGWKSWGEWVWIVWRGRCGLFSVLHFSRQPTSALRDVDFATPTLNSSDSPIYFRARVILQCIAWGKIVLNATLWVWGSRKDNELQTECPIIHLKGWHNLKINYIIFHKLSIMGEKEQLLFK